MTFKLFDKVGEVTNSVGTGDFVLSGAFTGHRAFSIVGNGESFPYHCTSVDADGNESGEWETGIGVYNSSANSIVRAIPNVGSSAVPVSFSAGTKKVTLSLISSIMYPENAFRSLELLSPGFNAAHRWDFNTDEQGWALSNGALTWVATSGGSLELSDSSSTLSTFLTSPAGLSIDGARHTRIKIGVTRVSGSSFNGALQYTTAGHPTFGPTFGKTITAPASLINIGEMSILDWDMEQLTAGGTDWVTNIITRFRLILPSTPATDDVFRIHWIAVGSNEPVRAIGDSGLVQYSNGGVITGVTAVKSDGTDILRVSDDSPIVFDKDVRAGAPNLNTRIANLANFSSPNAGGYVSGQFSDNNPHCGVGTLAGAANRMDMAPFFVSETLTIDQIGCAVSTGVAASLFKVVVYSSSTAGWPDALLYESGDLSGATATLVVATTSFTFQPGIKYWVGVRHSSTCTLRTIAVASAYSLGLTTGAGATQASIVRRTLTYATAATDPWNFVFSDLVVNVTPPSIRFRKA